MTSSNELTGHDRCDRCQAQALVKVYLQKGFILFCYHHAEQHLPEISKIAISVVDERERVTT